MASLPTVGSSDGTWGTELNAYLGVGHGSDGLHSEAGLVRQIAYAQTQTKIYEQNATATPSNAKPQNNTGLEVLTCAIVPKSATNILKIEAIVNADMDAATSRTIALFQDSTADAIACTTTAATIDTVHVMAVTYFMSAGTTSSTTFKVRVGCTGATADITVNGDNNNQDFYDGALTSTLSITEIQV